MENKITTCPNIATITGEHFRIGTMSGNLSDLGTGKGKRDYFSLHIDYGNFLENYNLALKDLFRDKLRTLLYEEFHKTGVGCILVIIRDGEAFGYIGRTRGYKADLLVDEDHILRLQRAMAKLRKFIPRDHSKHVEIYNRMRGIKAS
jgi:hypothetical protein